MSAKASRKLAESKADDLIALMYGGAPVARAGKQIAWFFRDGQRIPISNAEDLFGCFDRLVVLPHGLVAIQATIHRPEGLGGGAVSARRSKVAALFARPLLASMGEAAASDAHRAELRWLRLEVWGWELRRAMHVWSWSWSLEKWIRQPTTVRVKKGELVYEERAA